MCVTIKSRDIVTHIHRECTWFNQSAINLMYNHCYEFQELHSRETKLNISDFFMRVESSHIY